MAGSKSEMARNLLAQEPGRDVCHEEAVRHVSSVLSIANAQRSVTQK